MVEQLDLGTVCVAPGTREALSQWGVDFDALLARHAGGDWGHFGRFDLGPLNDDPIRTRAVLFLMFDALFGGRDSVLLESGDIDLAAGTAFGRHRREVRKLSEEGQAALKTWLDKSAIQAGKVFPGLDAAAVRDMFRAIQDSVTFANSVAVLMGRGPVDSLYFIELPSRQQSPALLVIRTSLDRPRQTTAELTENRGVLIQLSMIAAPHHMFGPGRTPFERRRFGVQLWLENDEEVER